ncbi:MAG: hypothetical protein Q8P93_00775 [bacterium]|nr:hypothetical protein [bacterium]
MYTWRHNKGFVLVYAVFLSGIILTIGVGALGLVLRGFQLATTSRDSQMALFAADSAIECVTYWDFKFSNHGLEISPFAYDSEPNPITDEVPVLCNGSESEDGVGSNIKDAAPIGGLQNPNSQLCESYSAAGASSGTALGEISPLSNGAFFEEREVVGESKFTIFDVHFDNGSYAVVTVERSKRLKDEEGYSTRISSCGYNDDDPDSTRRVERGVTFQY